MHYLCGFVCAVALGVLSLVGCGETTGEGGGGGSAGTGGSGGTGVACEDGVCPCTEAGIRAAISEGGGPFTFDCNGPTTVVTEAEIVIDNDVILDGEGNLTVDGTESTEDVFDVSGATVALLGLSVSGGELRNGGGTLTLMNSEVDGVLNLGILTVTNSTVSPGGLLHAGLGYLTLVNSTVSGLARCAGVLAIRQSTIAGTFYSDTGGRDCLHVENDTEIANSLIEGKCIIVDPENSPLRSLGYNIESPGDTCGFDHPTDQVNVTAEALNLGRLANNGGPTQTHALLPGSVAIDAIPEAMCEVNKDQRGELRPETGGSMCDVGSFEVQEGGQ